MKKISLKEALAKKRKSPNDDDEQSKRQRDDQNFEKLVSEAEQLCTSVGHVVVSAATVFSDAPMGDDDDRML